MAVVNLIRKIIHSATNVNINLRISVGAHSDSEAFNRSNEWGNDLIDMKGSILKRWSTS